MIHKKVEENRTPKHMKAGLLIGGHFGKKLNKRLSYKKSYVLTTFTVEEGTKSDI